MGIVNGLSLKPIGFLTLKRLFSRSTVMFFIFLGVNTCFCSYLRECNNVFFFVCLKKVKKTLCPTPEFLFQIPSISQTSIADFVVLMEVELKALLDDLNVLEKSLSDPAPIQKVFVLLLLISFLSGLFTYSKSVSFVSWIMFLLS